MCWDENKLTNLNFLSVTNEPVLSLRYLKWFLTFKNSYKDISIYRT